MFEGMYAAAAGMEAQQRQIGSIGNDLANASTTGYKAGRMAFRDLLYNQAARSGTATQAGAGAAAQLLGADQSQGAIRQTSNPLDMAIEGEGFFTVRRPDGSTALTRDGAFELDAQGRLTTAAGDLVQPPLTLPPGTTPGQLSISRDGTVRAGARTLGRIELVTVAAPDRLQALGDGLFAPTAASGAPVATREASVHQGALEGSNVDVGTEMVQMIDAQRSYQLESSAVQTENQMLSIANQLRA
jgi:flagellar basal-body rod protein FlgG